MHLRESRWNRTDGSYLTHLQLAETLGYKPLQRVEEAWRTLESGRRHRSVFHRAVYRIHAHVPLTVLALLLERTVERPWADTWRNIRGDLKQIKLAQLLSPNGTLWQVTEPRPDARKRLKSLRIDNRTTLLRAA